MEKKGVFIFRGKIDENSGFEAQNNFTVKFPIYTTNVTSPINRFNSLILSRTLCTQIAQEICICLQTFNNLIIDKKRRNFELLVSFLDYVNGNIAVNLLNKYFQARKSIVIPIYFTKFCAHNIASIPYHIFSVLGY
jgi:hypothetical protein